MRCNKIELSDATKATKSSCKTSSGQIEYGRNHIFDIALNWASDLNYLTTISAAKYVANENANQILNEPIKMETH